MKSLKFSALAAVSAICLASTVFASDYVWTNALSDGDWANPKNFTLNDVEATQVPGSGDTVAVGAETVTFTY